ncbi:MAG: GNAT family N-acetyltransferase [Candidatus Eremiobacteraeota bacterium]|nr:GNAT family N-acetyltransferase [Candidatus Eremiobacteraeota bacterium]
MVNLVADLRGERFAAAAMREHEDALMGSGFELVRYDRPADALLAWIDEKFGGAWSAETFAGKSVVAKRDGRFAAFAGYGATGLKYRWLHGWRDTHDTGIFGPFGVDPEFRRAGLGAHILHLALGALRAGGLRRALIPAVGGESLIRYYMRESGATIADEFDLANFTSKPVRTTVLVSGNGTNFQAVIDAISAEKLPLDLAALVSNDREAYALKRAETAHVPVRLTVQWDRAAEPRAEYDARLAQCVEETAPELVLLLGWMHLLAPQFVRRFREAINIHPAFLPHDQSRDIVGLSDGSEMSAFRGAHAVRDALAAGSRWVGATAHRVTAGTDRGPVLVRKPVAVAAGWTQAEVMQRLRPVEHAVLLGGIRRWLLEREG